MGLTNIKLDHAVQIPHFLNAALAVTETEDGEVVTNTTGLYPLIDDIISKIVAIKNNIKTNEKTLLTAIQLEAVAANAETLNAAVFDPTTGAGLTVATLTTGAATGFTVNSETMRGQESLTAANHVAMLTTGTDKYTESAVASVMADIWKTVTKLKNGALTADGGAHDADNISLTALKATA